MTRSVCASVFDEGSLRILTAGDGHENHDLVPVELVARIADLRHGGVRKFISDLMRHKLLHHEESVRWVSPYVPWI